MDVQLFLDRINDLTDLELAVLLSLVAQHHCLVETYDEVQDEVASELALIVRDIFGLSYIILDRDDLQSVDKFGSAILDQDPGDGDSGSDDEAQPSTLRSRLASVSFGRMSSSHFEKSQLDSRRVVNVVIAKDFNLAHDDVQVQALELVRTRRIYSRTTVHAAPMVFLFLPIVTTSSKHVRLNKHLNDRIFMSHFHGPDDGFPNLEEMNDPDLSDSHVSTSSFPHPHSPSLRRQGIVAARRIQPQLIDQLRRQGEATTITPEIRRYMQDLVAFLRMERGVDGGVTPYATTLFVALSKYLAPFHGIDYVTPSLVALAAKKIYPHRLVIATPARERSVQYGTDMSSARDVLADLEPDTVIQSVLDSVDCPV